MRFFLITIFTLVGMTASAAERRLVREGRVLAHSLHFDPHQISSDMPPALQQLLRAYRQGERYATPVPGKAVAPLLLSVRHQEEPYNLYCPYYIYDDGRVSETRCVSGCVATCIEQVLTYWRYPEVLADTLHGWETDHYTIPDVLPGATIDWNNVLPNYAVDYTEQQGKAVGELTYYCGMAAHMNWGVNSSGANLYRAAEPLKRAFGYKTVEFVQRCFYTPERWDQLLRTELEQGRPICYTGHNMAMSGHAFNIDGVDAEGYYHINWGYGGSYDGYFDLDFLNPFEDIFNATHLGQQEGFFSNQTALFLCPEELDIDLSDSLAEEKCLHGVQVEELQFRRNPDTQGYVVADCTLRNMTDRALSYTLELLTYLPTDTAIFLQADYVALSTVSLKPGERRTVPFYCQFVIPGERILALSTDDETFEWQSPVSIEKGTTPKLEYSDISYRLVRYGDDLTAQFSIDISNQATSGYAGNLVTFCLFEDDAPDDLRHWDILSIPAGSTQHLTTTFHHLTEGRRYELLVRCPWPVRQTISFLAEDAEDAISTPSPRPSSSIPVYDLLGRPSRSLPHSIAIRRGRKFLQ